jgi:NifU-like protein involved in Fe-S cluster formation
VNAAPYSAEVLDLLARTPGAGRPQGGGWASGEGREPLTATHVRFHLQQAGGRIAAARYEVRGCPHTIALAALAAAWLPGREASDVVLDVRALATRLQAPTGKLGRFLAVQDAIGAAALQLARRPA